MASVSLTLQETAKLFFKVIVLFYILIVLFYIFDQKYMRVPVYILTSLVLVIIVDVKHVWSSISV